MMCKHLTFFFALIVFSTFLFGQIDKQKTDRFDFFSDDDFLVKKSLNNTVCLIKQEYTLIDKNGVEYGRKADPYFGKKYAIGVITDSGIVTVSSIKLPWEKDVNFEPYKKVDSLKPHLSKTYFKRFSDKIFVRLKNRKYVDLNQNTTLLPKGGDSLPKIAYQKFVSESVGWLVLGYLADGQNANDTARLTVSVVKPVFEPVDVNGRVYIKNLVLRDKIIGGVFFSASITTGKVSFSAAGNIQEDSKGYYIAKPQDIESKETPPPLSPINKPKIDEPQKIIDTDGNK